jgi:hypothetical protein
MMRPIGQADFLEELLRSWRRLRYAGDLHRHENVLEGRQRRQQMEELKHEADARAAQLRERVLPQRRDVDAVEHDVTRRRRVQAGQQPEQGRFAAARRPGDRHDPPGLDGQVDRMKDGQGTSAARHGLGNTAQLDHEAPDI